MEICLATYRHKPVHGEAFSPFRSLTLGLNRPSRRAELFRAH
jgi:hypothetical protein